MNHEFATADDSTAQVQKARASDTAARRLTPPLAGRFILRYGVLLAMILTFVGFSLVRPSQFLSWTIITAIPRDGASLIVAALGVTIVLVMNDFDLSVGGMIGLIGTSTVVMISTDYGGLPIYLSIVFSLVFGFVLGCINGYFVAFLGASSFIATIAMGTLYSGLDLGILDSQTIYRGMTSSYREIGQGTIGTVSNLIFIALLATIVIYVFLEHTEVGRHMYAIGANSEAARVSGIRVRRLRALGFGLVGVCAALVAILISSQAGAANPNSGTGLLLPAYAAAFLGSSMWRLGRFTAIGTVLGALFLQIIGTGLSLFSIKAWVVLVIQGTILIVAVTLSRMSRST